MASHNPFRVFRKYQKQSLAVLGVLAMLSFVVIPTCGYLNGTGGPSPGVVVTTRKYGDLREAQLHSAIQRQGRLAAVFQAIAFAAFSAENNYMDAMPAQQVAREIEAGASERHVVQTWLLAQQAKEMGLVITDDEVNRFLSQVTRGKVDNDVVTRILRDTGFSQAEFFDLLQQNFAARRLEGLFQSSLMSQTPGQRWDAFLRLYRRAKIEAAVVPIDRFLDQVPDPDDATVKQFFDEHRFRFYNPATGEAGFRQPRKRAIEYVKAPFAGVDPASIAMEEVQVYYNENRHQFPVVRIPAFDPPASVEPKADDLERRLGTLPGMNLLDAIAPDDQTEPVVPVEEVEPIEGVTAPIDETTPADAPPPGDGADAGGASPFRLVSLQTDADEAVTTLDNGDTNATTSAEDPAVAAEEEPEYEPLENVEGRIRQTLAQQKVLEQVEAIRRAMNDHRAEYRESLKQDRPAPAPLDLKQLAEQSGFVYQRTGLIPAYLMAERDIAQATIREEQGRPQQALEVMYTLVTELQPQECQDLENAYLFWIVEQASEHVAQLSDPGIRDDVVRQWKQIAARKLAVEKANQLADEARASRKSLRETFADRTDIPVVEPLPFTWMDYGGTTIWYREQNPPAISTIVEVDAQGVRLDKPQLIVAPGDGFMRAVFSLEVGEIGVATNQPESAAYVIRLVETTPSQGVLWSLFKTEQHGNYRNANAFDVFEGPRRAWIESLERDAGLKWIRPAQEDDQRDDLM